MKKLIAFLLFTVILLAGCSAPAAPEPASALAVADAPDGNGTAIPAALAWIVAGLAAVALIYSVASDLRQRLPEFGRTMRASTVRSK